MYDQLSPKQKDRLNREVCLSCGNDSGGKKLCSIHMQRQSITARKIYKNLKTEVFSHYGNKCECCDEPILAFLSLDHRDLNKKGELTGSPLYQRAKRDGYPGSLRLLCFNCNFGRKKEVCPHVSKDEGFTLSDLPYQPREIRPLTPKYKAQKESRERRASTSNRPINF